MCNLLMPEGGLLPSGHALLGSRSVEGRVDVRFPAYSILPVLSWRDGRSERRLSIELRAEGDQTSANREVDGCAKRRAAEQTRQGGARRLATAQNGARLDWWRPPVQLGAQDP